MQDQPTDPATLEAALVAQIAAASDPAAIEAVRVAALGKKGSVTALLKSLGTMTPDERQARGPAIHALKERVTHALASARTALEDAALAERLAGERIDLSLPAQAPPRGTVHPVSQVMDELAEIFADLGFAVATGPEIEDEWHNFTALNMPESHPARAMHDTFYVRRSTGGDDARIGAPPLSHVLRTHTSPVQIRTMTSQEPPIRIIAPGRVYRADSDATHTPMFHQIEGLVIDRAIHMGHLLWTLETFLKAFFETDAVQLRLRPSYFPFTEPSAEVDVGFRWDGARRIIGGSGDDPGHGWMEVLGSGMVHPNVIAACGLDPAQWQGFAFGTGVDRLAMLKYGMDDLRAFFDGDQRWLAHYGFDALAVPTLSGGVNGGLRA